MKESPYILVWLLHRGSMGCSLKDHQPNLAKTIRFLTYECSILPAIITETEENKQKQFNWMLLTDYMINNSTYCLIYIGIGSTCTLVFQ